jgi:hypothetical protein
MAIGPFAVIAGPTIGAGEYLSSILNVSTGNAGIVRITMPDAWTGNAWLMFQISQDGTYFSDLVWPNGSPVVVTVVPGATVVTQTDTWQAAYFKFRSGRAATPIPQLEERKFICVTR